MTSSSFHNGVHIVSAYGTYLRAFIAARTNTARPDDYLALPFENVAAYALGVADGRCEGSAPHNQSVFARKLTETLS